MAAETNNLLLVPMHIDALHVPVGGMHVREAFADYTLLPYVYGTDDGGWTTPETPRAPNLSSTVLSKPYVGGYNLQLGAGIHLHWALPEALTHGIQQDDHQGALIFPAVPSRWLVTRKRSGAIERQWVVESDYLHPDLTWINPSDHVPPDSVAVPFPFNDVNTGPYQPFRFMGQTLPADGWSPSDPTDKNGTNEYLGRYGLALTATGVFEKVPVLDHVKATFAGFYPNCRGVFGLHDDNASLQGDLTGLTYEVLGWYADQAKDCLGAFVDATAADDPKQRMHDFKDLFEWSFDPGDTAFPRRTVLHGRLTFQHAVVENPAATTHGIELALGNTPTEALSAYVAQALAKTDAAPENKPLFEEQLEAIQLAENLNQRTVDIGAAFHESRHTHGFTPRAGGILWSVQLATAGKDDDEQETALPEELAHRLNQLNELQQEYDRAVDTIASLGDRLFADWCAWMTINYYSNANEPDGPCGLCANLDDLFPVVEQGGVAPQRKFMTDTGQLVLTMDPATGEISAAAGVVAIRIISTQDPDSADIVDGLDTGVKHLRAHFADCGIVLSQAATLRGVSPSWTVSDGGVDYPLTLDGDFLTLQIPAFAAQQAAVLAKLLGDFQRELAGAAPACTLRATGAPRYWQPNEPVALMFGPSVVATDRFGVDGPLPCVQLAGPEVADADLLSLPADPNGLLTRIRFAVDAIAQGGDPGFTEWSMQPWNPFMLEWNARYDSVPRSGDYQRDSVTNGYALASGSCGLSPRGLQTFTADTEDYNGFSILTPDAGETVSRDLAAYIASEHEALPQPFSSDLAGLQNSTTKVQQYLDNQIAALQTAYAGAHPPDPKDPLRTAIRAYSLVTDKPSLSQALGGFNDALITMAQTMQLAIADPMLPETDEYEDSMRLASETSGLVSGTLIRAPEPHRAFSPVRNGKLTISGLHLLDSFGRLNNLTWGDDTTATEVWPRLPDGSFVLEPRLCQPSRLLFRWLAATPVAGTDDYETNAHPASSPICGWVLPNNLDGSLMVYDADGVGLGLVDERGVWMPAPGTAHPVAVHEIANPHLQRLVAHVTSAGDNGEQYLGQLLAAIDASLETIDPESFAQHEGLALLMGRPVALVRAAVRLEVQGLPARDNGWDVIAGTVAQYQHDKKSFDPITANPTRFTAAFDTVDFEVRIGEPGRLNDGLVGYWVEDAHGDYVDGMFHAPGGGEAAFDGGGTGPGVDNAPKPVLQSIAAPDTVVSMLLDPRGSVHVTSGILPVKSIAIPQDQYLDALKRIDITFLIAPILAPGTDYDALDGSRQVPVPLPTDPSYTWSWLAREGIRWAATTTFSDTSTAAVFAGQQWICEGWLKLDATD